MRPTHRSILTVSIVATLLLLGMSVASADHSWNGYHWRSDKLSPTVVNKASSSLYNVPAGVQEWADLSAPINPTMTTATKGNITVSEGFSVFWLGLARVFVEDGHITKGEVKLNTRLLRSYGAGAADHVLCQEIGHVLGLDHNRDQNDTCMNDQAPLGSAMSPNAHDNQQLSLIYNHVDGAASGSASSAPGGGNGHWITVHVFPAP